MTTATPTSAHMGTFLAQWAAVEIVDKYRAGTLPDETRRFVDMTIDQCELQGDAARQWVDGLVALTVRRWVDAQAAGDSAQEARSLMIASCALAAFMLHSDVAAPA